MSLIIRPPDLSDFEQWNSLWVSYNESYGRVGQSALSETITRTTWNRFFDPEEQVHCFVAEYDGEIVGLAHSVFHRNTILVEPTCYLQDLFTSSSLRGKGVGQALIDGVFEHAANAGVKSIYWHTHLTNDAAMKLYDKVATNTDFTVYRKRL